MELVRSASSEGESSPSIGNTRRKRKPTATQSSGQYTKRPKTLPVVTTVPLRKSARLIARQLRIADEEKAKAAAAAAEEARNKRGSSSGSAESSTSRSGGGKKSRETPSSSSSASIEEVSKSSSESKSDTRTQGKAPKARVGSSRKRKRSNSPRYKPSTTHSKTKECSSPAPPLRRSSRNSAVSDRLQSAERDTPTISGTGGDPKHKNPAKRQRTNRSNKSAPTAASGSSCAKNQQTAGSKVEKTETGEIHSPVANTTSQVSAKDSGASLPGTTNKGKRREKSRKVPTVPIGESVEGQAKRFTRRKEAGKDAGKESVVAEGEFDRHGRRVTGKSVICEPQKGKSARSVKGKGRARTEIPRQSSGSTRISIPSFIEFGTLGMSDARSSDKATASGGGGEKGGGGKGTEAGKKEGGDGASNSSSDSTLAASMSEDNHRLQSMLEAQGLPPHLLGALGSKMQYILHKSFSSMSSSNSSRAHQLLTDMESGDESTQLQACIEVGQLLVMGNEETLGGFPVKQAVPILSNLLSLEHNFDMMVQACRALSYMMDALPRSSAVVAKTIPLLVKKLQVIQCMDVAEQALSALELLSRRHGKDILQARRALSVTANCCYSLAEEDFPLVVDSVPILTARLQHQDKKSVESCCQCFSRVVESFSSNQTILRQIVTTALLQNLQQLLVVSPPAISSGTFVTVLRMLSTLCSACPPLAVELLTINIADTLRYLLAGSGEITLDNIELMSRSPNEVYEILSLTGHLMPPLPRDGIFEIEAIISTKKHAPSVVQWEWQENEGSWRAYNSLDNRNIEMAHLAHEEECNISVMGRDYTIDLGTMQQINEDTGTTRSVRRKILDRAKSTTEQQSTVDTDARAVALNSDPALGSSFVKALFAVLYELFNSMAGSSVHNKCLKTILRVLYHSDSEVLEDILRDIPVSRYYIIIAHIKSCDSL
ncbi:E3 ubiquitin-protein ligase TRIP12, partial [Geodia barretti]